jgi:hypothetical protein
MVDIIAISALIIAVLSGLSRFINDSHLKKVNCFCINSDCSNTDEIKEKKLEETIIKLNNKLNILKNKNGSGSNILKGSGLNTPTTPDTTEERKFTLEEIKQLTCSSI